MAVISDTGPLIALAKIARLNLLEFLFGKIYVVPAVYKELMAKAGKEGNEIDSAFKQFIKVVEMPTSLKAIDPSLDELGIGEKQSIEYAYSDGRNGPHLLIIDDKAGRRTAEKLGIPKLGTVGIVILAKKKGLIQQQVSETLEAMRENGYWLSDNIIGTAKLIAGE